MIAFFKNQISNFVFGLQTPLLATRLIIKNPSLLLLALFPTLIAAGLYAFVLIELQATLSATLKGLLLSWGLTPEGWTFILTQILIAVILFLAGALTFSFATSIFASPFNDFLAERTERFTNLSPAPFQPWRAKFRLLLIDLVKTGFTLLAALLALIVSWIPILNLFALTLSLLLLCFQYVSYPQTRRGLGLFASAGFLFRHFFLCLGFGAIHAVLFSVPFLSILALPIAVVGGTLLYAKTTDTAPL